MSKVMIASVALMILVAAAEAQAGMTLSSAQTAEPGCTTTTDTDITGGRSSTNGTLSMSVATTAAATNTKSLPTSAPNGSATDERGKSDRARYFGQVIQRIEDRVLRKPWQVQVAAHASDARPLNGILERIERRRTFHKIRRRETACSCGI